MSGNFEDDKLPANVEFSPIEITNMQKTTLLIQKNFLRQHVEITAISTSDLTDMIRQEKQMYGNLGIQYAVGALAALEKVKKK